MKLDRNQGRVWGLYVPNKTIYDAICYMVERMPIHGLDWLHQVTGDDKWDNYSQMLAMVWDKIDELAKTFEFFV